MKKAPMVLLVGILLVISSVGLAEMTPEKAEFYQNLESALTAYHSGQALTPAQHDFLERHSLLDRHRQELDYEGGPDTFGYYFVDSQEPDGPDYEWVDITETGTPITGWEDDITLGPFDIGFDFPFYGETYDQVWLCSNGWMTFSAGQNANYWWETSIPHPDLPNNAIYWFAQDLLPNEQDVVYYGDDGNGNALFQFEFANGAVQAEVILYPDGIIKIQYGPEHFAEIGWDGVRVAVENIDGTDGVYACDHFEPDGWPFPELAVIWETLEMGYVEGTVTDVETEAPVEDALVELMVDGVAMYNGRTDQAGNYSIRAEIGNYDVMASAFTYFDSDPVAVTVEDDQVAVVDFQLEQAPAPTIEVNPEALVYENPWRGAQTQIFTVGNNGGADLDFEIDIEIIPPEEMGLFQFQRRIREIRSTINHPVPATKIAAGPSSADLANRSMNQTPTHHSELDDPYFLVFQDDDPWWENNTHLDYLNLLEIPYDLVGSAMMEDQDLGDYTVIMVPSCQQQEFYDTFMMNEERFEDFVDNGGWLEYHGCTQGANWTLWDGTQYVHVDDQENYVIEPDHPICLDIPEMFTGNAANHGYLDNVPDESLVLIVDSFDRPVVIETPYGRGNMIVSSETWEWGADQEPQQGAGFVMQNAILYSAENAGGGWLYTDISEGSVVSGQTIDINTTADASVGDLLPGVYEAVISVSTLFPNVEPADVWVTLTVLDPGSIAGTVYDSATMEVLPGAMIYRWLNGEIVEEIECDEQGYYSFPAGEGTHILTADAVDYYENDPVNVDVLEGVVTQHDFLLDREIPPTITFPDDVLADGLVFEIEWGALGEIVLPLSNYGGLPLNWQSKITYIEDAEMMRFQRNRRIEREALINPTAVLARREANIQTINFNNFDIVEGSSPNIVNPDYNPHYELDEGPILLMGQMDFSQSLMAALNNLGVDYTHIQSDNYANVDLEEYGVLITGHDGGAATVADCQAAIDFCANGGNLLYFGGLPNMYQALMANDVINISGTGWWFPLTPHIVIVDPEHPLALDVPDGYNFFEEGAALSYFRYSDPDAEVVARNGEGQDILLAKDYQSGRFMAFANSPGSWYWQNNNDQQVLTTIMRNMLDYAGGGWLTVEPDGGTVEVDGTIDLNLTADAVPDSLHEGSYEAVIEFTSDHWAVDPVEVWATFIVHNGPPAHQWIGTEDEPLNTNYFELISFWLDPVRFGDNALDVFGIYPSLAAAYQNDGSIFVPDLINDIETIDIFQGYRIFLRPDEEWTPIIHVQGDPVDPATAEYSANANMINWIGYPFNYEMPVEVALASIADDIHIVYNDEGEIWIPNVINSMGMMTPGEGYIVIPSTDITFTYDTGVMAAPYNADVWSIPVVEDAPVATGLPYPVLVTLSEELKALEPATIEIFDNKKLVGKAVVLDDKDFTPVITWQGSDEYKIQGFEIGNEMSFVLKTANGSTIPVVINDALPAFGEGAYANVTLNGIALPTSFTVSNGYPNPFNPSITVPFALPRAGKVDFKVFNVLGQEVLSQTRSYEVGHHKFLFNASNDLVSGVYFLQVEFNRQIHTQKLMLLK